MYRAKEREFVVPGCQQNRRIKASASFWASFSLSTITIIPLTGFIGLVFSFFGLAPSSSSVLRRLLQCSGQIRPRPQSSSSVLRSNTVEASVVFFSAPVRSGVFFSAHLQRLQFLAPLLDLEIEDEDDECSENCEIKVTRRRDLRLRNQSLRLRAAERKDDQLTQIEMNGLGRSEQPPASKAAVESLPTISSGMEKSFRSGRM